MRGVREPGERDAALSGDPGTRGGLLYQGFSSDLPRTQEGHRGEVSIIPREKGNTYF